MRVLGLIPARGGSKGVPGKNIRPLAGKSLIQRAFECAAASGVLDRIVLSTDHPAIAEAARAYGLDDCILRPAELARDESPMIDVAVHALKALEATSYTPDAVLLLQPTSPLRRAAHLREAVRLLGEHDAVCSVAPLPKELCPHFVMRITAEGYLDHFMPDGALFTRRQDVPTAYKRDGTVYLTRVPVILEQRSFYGRKCVPMMVPPDESLSIDTPAQWEDAERRLSAAGGADLTPAVESTH